MMSNTNVKGKFSVDPDNSQNEEQIKSKLSIALEEAYINDQYEQQCNILSKLAKLYLQQKNYNAAAKLLNGAIANCQTYRRDIQKQESLEKALLEQLKEVERRFVEEQLQISYQPKSLEQYGINSHYKKHLIELRNIMKEKLKKIEASSLDEKSSKECQEILKWVTNQIKELLKEMVLDCIEIMHSPPPCNYALIGIGSLAREEMTPYSDLECFILIEKDESEYKQYFNCLSQLLELKIINLGETDLVKRQTILPRGMLSPVRKGFSLDIHKTPANSQHNQIGTPIEMARYQLPEQYVNEEINHLSSALLNVTFITGMEQGKDLLKAYHQAVNENLNQVDPSTQKSLRLTRTLLMLKDDADHFEPKLRYEDEGKLFQVKDDFYRLPQTIIDALALHQGLRSSSTWDRIDELCDKQFMSIEAGQHLKQVLSQANEWRLKTYSHYNGQREIVDILVRFSTVTSIGSHEFNPPQLSELDIKVLTESYKTLIPLHFCTKVFSETDGTFNPFIINQMYDNSFFSAGKIASRLCQYTEAKRLFELELEKYKNETGGIEENIPVVIMSVLLESLGNICSILGDFKKALEYYEKILTLKIKLYGFEHPDLVTCYDHLGSAWQGFGDSKKAVEYYEKSLDLNIKVHGPEDHGISANYNNLGEAWRRLGNGKKAIEYHEKALAIETKIYNPKQRGIATIYNNLGAAYQLLGDGKKGVGYQEKALAIFTQIYGFEHPLVAMGYNNLGSAWQVMGEDNRAVKYHEKALSIRIQIYGFEHPDVVMSYNNLGEAWRILGDCKKAVEYHEKALAIGTKIYNPKHSDIARSYDNLGKAWITLGNPYKAAEYLEKALSIQTQLYDRNHSDVSTTYNSLGLAWRALGNVKKAVEYLEQALTICIKVNGPEHFFTATIYNNLGITWQTLDDSKKAKDYHEKALAIRIKVCNSAHPDLASTYHNLGSAYQGLGERKKAVKYYEKSLAILMKIYDYKHPDVAMSYNNLGTAWEALGDAEKAIEYHEKALDIRIQVYGLGHPDVAMSYNNLGTTWLKLKNAKKAVEYHEKAIAIYIKLYSPEHPSLATNYNNIASAWLELGDIKKTIEYLEKALVILTKTYGLEHPKVAYTYSTIGTMWKELGNESIAVQYYEKAIKVLIKLYGPMHPDLVSTRYERDIALSILNMKTKNPDPNDITISFAGDNDYISRLKFILGEDIVKINSNENKVFFPLFWLRQLEHQAINELSTELKTDFKRFLHK